MRRRRSLWIMASISAVAVIKMYCCVLMKRNSATMKSAADQRLTLPLSAAWAPELIAVSIAAVLMPPSADMTISRSTACGGSGRRWRRRGAAAELFFLGLNELTIVGRIEVKKRPAGSKMLNENPADHPGGTGREYRHRKRADRRSESREAFHKAPHTDHGSCRGARWD